MQRSLTALAAAGLAVAGFGTQAHAQACGTIVGDGTNGAEQTLIGAIEWGGAANPSPICLEEPIYIGDGTAANASVLTILPGTIVRGQPRFEDAADATPLDGNPGAVIVTRYSQINAAGTASNPIIMTTAAVDNNGDGVCDDGNGDGFTDPHPGYQDIAGCIDAGTCATAEVPANAVFCDATPLVSVLSPLNADGHPNVSLWGGLALEGNAPTNLANNAAVGIDFGTGLLEGVRLPGTPQPLAEYGGPEPHDNSGILRYVSVRYAGDEILPDNELNGVSMAGVGDGTIYEFTEVYANFDDGTEWFGGTVNGNHLVTLYAGDDQFDIDQGFTGNLQFLLAISPFFTDENFVDDFGSNSGDAIGEWDGVDGNNEAVPNIANRADVNDADEDLRPWPFPNSNVWNLTALGGHPDNNPAVSPVAAGTYRGVRMRHGFAGHLACSIVANTTGGASGGECVHTDTDVAGMAPAGFLTQDNVAAVEVTIHDTTCNIAPGGLNLDADNLSGITVVAEPTTLILREDPNHDGSSATGIYPEAGMTDTNGYDPRPTNAEDCEVPQEKSLDRSATYRGAFEPGVAELWTTGWTAAEIGNMLSR